MCCCTDIKRRNKLKKFLIEWETDFCDDFPERMGVCEVEAETKKDAIQNFYTNHRRKHIITNIEEI